MIGAVRGADLLTVLRDDLGVTTPKEGTVTATSTGRSRFVAADQAS